MQRVVLENDESEDNSYSLSTAWHLVAIPEDDLYLYEFQVDSASRSTFGLPNASHRLAPTIQGHLFASLGHPSGTTSSGLWAPEGGLSPWGNPQFDQRLSQVPVGLAMTDEEATAWATQMAYEIQHVCEPCGEVFQRPADLTRHRDKHLRPYQCLFYMPGAFPSQCTERFAAEKDLERHHNVTHKKRENVEKYTCADCGTEFTRDDNLVRHRNETCKSRVKEG